MIYIVLGMHKSGTTLVSKMLHLSGINMGDDIDDQVSYDKGNQYERLSTQLMNKEILGVSGKPSLDIKIPAMLQITEDQRSQIRKIIGDCEKQYVDWGFKDPRSCLTYPLWESELPEHKLIVVYRELNDLAPRYHADIAPHRAWKLVNRWCEHNKKLIAYLQNTRMKFLVLNYKKLMTFEDEFDRLQKFVGIKLHDQRKMDLYRGQIKDYFLVRCAKWVLKKKTCDQPEKIIEQYEMLK